MRDDEKQPDPLEPETYELADDPDDEPAPEATRPRLDPRLAEEDVELPPETAEEQAASGEDRPGVPKLLQGIPEPKFVDPQVQAMRREDQRKRAAEQYAIEAARKKKIKTIILCIAASFAALIALGIWLAT